ncbi:alpha-2-macroglobulin family protein [Zophobihabitans entericus]|uniref:Alpha-2-macroglobulin family protein n=1 Tax=Zophobihabitans entericus TaxID=1635327 RepID=A0A6G9IAA1_9GAMM|nr:alpha-2-macroglobulin [Zophobihabitans entericus]QIQ21143.1 alpha-2-macroglobulin family protein [Zophobihabitans entericus]
MLTNISLGCKKALIIGCLLALVGCDDSAKQNTEAANNAVTEVIAAEAASANGIDETTEQLVVDQAVTAESDSTEQVTTTENTVPDAVTQTPLNTQNSDALKQQYQNKPLKILDTSELILDGASTLVVTFSMPLDPTQDFSSVARLVDKSNGIVDGQWELSDNGMELRYRYLEPERKLIVTIYKQIKGITGVQLNQDYQTEIETRSRQPMVGFSSRGSLLPSQSKAGLPVMTLNVDRVDVNFFRVKEEYLYQFMRDYGNLTQLSVWDSQYTSKYTELVYSGRFDLKPRQNVQESVQLDLAAIEPLKKTGIYLAVMNQSGNYAYSNPASIFSISNIGVSAHLYQGASLMVYAQALDTGKPLQDVRLSLIFEQNGEYSGVYPDIDRTDENGFAELIDFGSLKASNGARVLLLADDGSQTSLVELNRGALDLSEFNITGASHYTKQLFTFGPRDLYRPGEKVFMNALLRDADGQMLPKQPIKVDIIRPDGTSAYEYVWQQSAPGFYQTDFIVPTDGATGKWSFKFNLGDDDFRYANFSVEEFLPERMAMELTPPSTKPILNSQNVNFDIKGWYLYGAPAAGNELQGQIYLKTQRTIAGLPGFQIGALGDSTVARQLTDIAQIMDNAGLTTVTVNSQNWVNIKSPVEVVLQASLLDAGGRPVNRRVAQTVWPKAQMPAVRALFGESEYYDWSSDRYVTRPTVDVDSPASFEIAYVDMEGNKLASNSLVARVVKERRDYYWTWSASEGWRYQYNQKEFVVAEDNLTVTKDNVAKFTFITDDWGSYRLEVVDKKSNIVSNMRFWSGYTWGDNTNGTGSVRPDQVKLSIDKSSYQVGDTAIVHVEAPAAGTGYIAVESNERMLWSQALTVGEGGVDVEIPIEDWKRHDLYITAVVVRPSEQLEVQTIKRAIGLLYLPINVADRQVNLTIDAPQNVLPSRTIPVKVKVDSATLDSTKPVTVLLSAVDSGVLNITNFVTPDPFTALLGRKRYDVDMYDVYGKLIEGQGRLISTSFGGDSDESDALERGGKKPLTEVKIVAQQLETVQLDENGEATLQLVLPDFNGELRLMAQVWDESRFGKAEQKMTVAAPMVVELSTPRFMSGGDRSIMALDIHNLTDSAQQVTVSVQTSGLVMAESAKDMTLSFAAKERQILQVPIIADYGYGQGTIRIDVKGLVIPNNPETVISRSWKIGVRPAYNAELRPDSFILPAGKTWTLTQDMVSGLIPNTVESQLVVASVPVINIAQYIRQLFAYPYGCLEQTISGLYPSLYANKEQLDLLGIQTDSDEARRRSVDIGIERILNMQRSNGGFGLWSKESEEEYWLTVYATDFLLRARERGYSVNTKALDRALNRIGEYLYDSSAFYNLNSYGDSSRISYVQFAAKSYAAMILARQNKLTPAVRNEINRLYLLATDDKNSNMLKSAVPVAHLAIAAKYAGYNKPSEELMKLAFTTKREGNYYWPDDYGTSVRDNSLILSILLENDMYPKYQDQYLVSLSKALDNRAYFSTQEMNSLFMSGWLLNQKNASNSWEIVLNGEKVTNTKPMTKSYTIEELRKGISVENTSKNSSLYVKFDVSGYPNKPPMPTANNQPLVINRSYYDLEGNKTSIDNLKVGDMVVVYLEVKANRRITDALVIDLLPAGLELENQNLENSSVSISGIPALSELLKRENSYDVKYREYRDDRFVAAVDVSNSYYGYGYTKRLMYLARAVTPGTYMVPAPYVESMYRAEWFAIGKTIDMMTIKDKAN